MAAEYDNKDFRDVLAEYEITNSMRRKGNRWDSPCSEALFRTSNGCLRLEDTFGF